MSKSKSIATLVIHAGDQVDRGNNAIFPPITTASSFIQPNLGEEGEFCYSRCSNPTRYAYETALAELEGGIYATATASGMAATALILELLPKDSHVLVMKGSMAVLIGCLNVCVNKLQVRHSVMSILMIWRQ